MRITKMMAENAARKLTRKQFDELELSRKLFKTKLTEHCFSLVHENVKKAFIDELLNKFLSLTSSSQLNGCGFSYDWMSLTHSIPSIGGNRINIQFENNSKIGKELFELYESNIKETDRLNKLKADIELALVSMKTLKRVEIEFPEALEFLPKNENTAIMVNINPIREQLKK